MAAVLRAINFHERGNTERQRLRRVFNCHLPWEDFSVEELLKRYRFGGESLLFIARLIDGEVHETTTKVKPGSSPKTYNFSSGSGWWSCCRTSTCFPLRLRYPKICWVFFCQFGPCFAIFPNFYTEFLLVHFFIAVNLGSK